MKRYRVVTTPHAEDNILKAHDWLKSENPVYAAKWLVGIRDSIVGLKTFPEAHAIAPESVAFKSGNQAPAVRARNAMANILYHRRFDGPGAACHAFYSASRGPSGAVSSARGWP